MRTPTEPSPREPGGRLARLTRRAWRLLRLRNADAEAVVDAALGDRIDGVDSLDGGQRDMIMRAVRFDRLRVADVMTPRATIMALDIESDLGEAARAFVDSEHSRLPLYRDTLDDPLGFVHVKDILALLTPNEAGEIAAKPSDHVLPKLRREILYVPASMRLPALLLKMQAAHIHLALVVDEYGGTDGIVSIEDVVEQVVGEIEDEYDEESGFVQSKGNGLFEADARADIAEVARALGADLALGDEEVEFDTVAGLAVALAGRLPQRGEVLHHPAGFDFEVLDADPRRVKRLRIRTVGKGQASDG